jgi:hypothetical protein
MTMNVRWLIVAGVSMMIAAGVLVSAPAASANSTMIERFSGNHTSQSRNGLTCRNSWYDTYGGTSCAGNPNQKWRLHVACQMQPDHKGVWNYGPGSDGFQCSWAIDNASVEWG